MVISLCCFPEDGKELYQNVKHVQGNYIGLLLVSLIDPIVLRVLDAIAILIAEASLILRGLFCNTEEHSS